MELLIIEVLALGALQGITEFLPLSSDGHLALAELLFGLPTRNSTLRILLHVATLLATLLVLRRQAADALISGLRGGFDSRRFEATSGGRDAATVLLAAIPTAAIGLALRNVVHHWGHSPLALGVGFMLTSLVVISTRWARGGRAQAPSALGAVLLGIAQGLALMPGLSRSGCTIAALLWLGVRTERAFELSMLASLPVVFGALLLELPGASSAGVGVAAFGAALAFAFGVGALVALRGILRSGYFALFALWLLPLAFATLTMARAWPAAARLP